MKKYKHPRFEVDLKTRLEQKQKAINAVRLPRLGLAPYRVYEIKEKKGVSKGTLNGLYSSGAGGKSSYNIKIHKSRQTGKTQWQQVIFNYIYLIDSHSFQQYNVQWLKEKQATLLRLKGHRVEPTTADDKSDIKPVRIGT